jgi:two-component system chemotaxis response regulator CheB
MGSQINPVQKSIKPQGAPRISAVYFLVRKVIVFGGSAGGIKALCSVLEGIPATIPAAALAVIHTTEKSRYLPEVFARHSHLKVLSPSRVEVIEPGRLYVPMPNRHLAVKAHCAVSMMGPRENRHRPAVDTLFRTAARVYRSHVVAVVLSGALDDGSAGAMAVKARGGTVIVQDPAEAQMDDMPSNVMKQVKTDFCLPIRDIPGLLSELAEKGPTIKHRATARECKLAAASEVASEEMEPTGFTCPDCGGALLQIVDGKNVQFRCHVGHNFSLDSFSEAHADALERALWTALRKLNEQKAIHESLAKGENGDPQVKRRFQENVSATEHDMKLLHEILARL